MSWNSPELWGGLECTVARIGERFRDQIAETGHSDRLGDLDGIAALGIRTLRYPALWETISARDPDECVWDWHDARFARLRLLGIRPIVGLVHHGSGPRYTSLLDPSFPALLATHAARVAARYPWIDLFTAVNEPLTTARFSGLYGHWYPHARSEAAFCRMVVIQCKASVLAMRAIRRITPSARLVQTEDIGKTFSTPPLQEQAAYENERRWLSLDLLCGRVDPAHPWYRRLIDHGVDPADLALLLSAEGAPDIIGANHYLTSERYLDGQASAYPKALRGGNGRRRYADVEAVRVAILDGATGPRARLAELWERYRRPIAVTEVHHGCSRDEQLRWFAEVWTAATDLRSFGVPVEAVTVWSLLGAYDWNVLLVSQNGFYEPGAFDIRNPSPRLTAIGRATRDVARTGRFDHPVLDIPGWWRRPERFYRGVRHSTPADHLPRCLIILTSGASSEAAFTRICSERGLAHVIVDASPVSTSKGELLAEAVLRDRAWAVVDASGIPRAAAAQRYPGGSFRADARGAEQVARTCARLGLPLLAFSSDRAFDGTLGRAYRESDAVRPGDAYGRSEAEAERAMREAFPESLVVRTGTLFGLGLGCFASESLRRCAAGFSEPMRPAETMSPTYLPDLIHAALDILIDGEQGVWHLVNQGERTWSSFVRDLAAAAHLPTPNTGDAPTGPLRNTALTSERGLIMPTVESAVERFVREAVVSGIASTCLAAE